MSLLFAALVLSSTYDKSGVLFGGTSVSIYKLLFTTMFVVYAVDPFRRKGPIAELNGKTYRWILAFIVVQTISSLLGLVLLPGPRSFQSELYHLIQRVNFLLIPLFAISYGFAPRSVLKLFLAAILIHYAFTVLQFASPSAYDAFVDRVYNPIRPDNSLGWSGGSLDFIGLQRSSNYGAFAASFGLLFLAFLPQRNIVLWTLSRALVGAAIAIALFGPSRAVLLMLLTALLIYISKTGQLGRMTNYLKASVLGLGLIGVFASGTLTLESLGSVNAFFSDQREGSNLGKLENAQWGRELFRESPLIGYGQRRFADLTAPLGNNNFNQAESHSYLLSTVLSSGLIGVLAYLGAFMAITWALWYRTGSDSAIVCALFIGLNVYNVVYDAGGLDVFACFNGIAAYYALSAPSVRVVSDRREVTRVPWSVSHA